MQKVPLNKAKKTVASHAVGMKDEPKELVCVSTDGLRKEVD